MCANYFWRKEFHLPLSEKWLETSEMTDRSDNYVLLERESLFPTAGTAAGKPF